jgi:ribonucleoside-diphosphate reductase alpha chain
MARMIHRLLAAPVDGMPPGEPAPQPAVAALLRERYCRAGETTADDVQRRVVRALAAIEPVPVRRAWEAGFLALLRAGFIPGGRIAAHAGDQTPMMINCFVQPLADSTGWPASNGPGVFAALGEMAQTIRLGGGVGVDLSPLRPCSAAPQATPGAVHAGHAAGVLAHLKLFEAAAALFDRAGPRRAALMGVLRCDHPDILAFIDAKRLEALPHFNLSVAVSDAFMAAVERDGEIALVHEAPPAAARASPAGQGEPRADGRWVHAVLPARRLWQRIVEAVHAGGDPGLLFIDRIAADLNLRGQEQVVATNPCGEVPLPAYGACCLGSFDLTRFVRRAFTPQAWLDLDALAGHGAAAVRLLDNVIELSAWPLPQQEQQAKAVRRIGIGFTGLGDALVMLGQRYGGVAAQHTAKAVARTLRDAVYAASVALARERGAFAAFDASTLLRNDGRFASRLPEPLRQAIAAHGLRHAQLLAVAPTGSVSLAFADNTSSGIEPVWSWRHRRSLCCGSAAAAEVALQDHAWRLYTQRGGEWPDAALPAAFVTALELTPEEHLAMVAAVAPFIDGSVSKTVNLPPAATPADLDGLFRRAHALGLKGITAFRPHPARAGVLSATGERA